MAFMFRAGLIAGFQAADNVAQFAVIAFELQVEWLISNVPRSNCSKFVCMDFEALTSFVD